MTKPAIKSNKIKAASPISSVLTAIAAVIIGFVITLAGAMWLEPSATHCDNISSCSRAFANQLRLSDLFVFIGILVGLTGAILLYKIADQWRRQTEAAELERDQINSRRLRERTRNIARVRRVKRVSAKAVADAKYAQHYAEKQLSATQAKSKQLLDKLKELKTAYDGSVQRYRYVRTALDEKQLKLDESSRALTILGNKLSTQKEQLVLLEKAGKEFKKVVSSSADQTVNLEILLSRIIPRPVVKQLDGKMPTDASVGKLARQVENVNILFADIVDYTASTEHKPPKQLLEELHELFSMFDERAQHYDVEKIKTIGDCYMAATGLFSRDHEAEKLIRFAESINNKIAAGGKWQLSIGIASGPVIAGIIGREKLAYDIWGHPVNLAARLQAAAKAEQILVSQRFRTQLLNNKKYQFNSVDTPNLKGISANVNAFELIVKH